MAAEGPQDLDRLLEAATALIKRAAVNLEFEPWRAAAAQSAGFIGPTAERITVSGVFEPRPPCERC